MQLNKNFVSELTCFSDSDLGQDKVDRKSVGEKVLFFSTAQLAEDAESRTSLHRASLRLNPLLYDLLLESCYCSKSLDNPQT